MDNSTTIHFAYSLSNNVALFSGGPGSSVQALLWLIPAGLIVSYFKQRHALQKLAWALLVACLLFYWEYHSLNCRFGTISYNKTGITLVQRSGQTITLTPDQVTRFRDITITSRGGMWGCYLQVNTADNSYGSYIVDTYSHSCLQDANTLNFFYRKTIPQL